MISAGGMEPEMVQQGSVPVPDPTKLTTDAVNAATDQWRRELLALKDLIGARLDASDEATRLRFEQVVEVGPQIKTQVNHLKELMQEKFNGVQVQFKERDVRTDQAARTADDALKAALQAAKELVNAQTEAS